MIYKGLQPMENIKRRLIQAEKIAGMAFNDRQIRIAFIPEINKNGTVIEEFKVFQHKCDIGKITEKGAIILYEIKSDLDDCSRLLEQLHDYMRFADRVYVICTLMLFNEIKSKLDKADKEFQRVGIIKALLNKEYQDIYFLKAKQAEKCIHTFAHREYTLWNIKGGKLLEYKDKLKQIWGVDYE